MSKQSFTAGPWHLSGRQSVRGPNGEYIAKTNWDNGANNARLIAAAPDLLEALVELVRQHKNIRVAEGYPTRESPATEAADAAISKALGDQP